MKVGDKVKKADATESSIPAYRDMRGEVVQVDRYGWVRVKWSCDKTPDFTFRNPSTLTKV